MDIDNCRRIMIIGGIFALLSVVLGAFSAHALKAILDDYAINLFETAARYQMFHAIALLICGVSGHLGLIPERWTNIAAIAFITGIVLFCCSLYLLGLTGMRWLGAITPIGGGAFIVGWVGMLIGLIKAQKAERLIDNKSEQ